MADTFLNLQDKALSDDFAAAKYRPLMKGWLNDALHRIYRSTRMASGDQKATITLTAGTDTYTLPATSIRVDSLRRPITGVTLSEAEVDTIDAMPARSGVPAVYALVGTGLILRPVPAAAGTLELRYRFNPVDMTADTDEPALPSDYRHMLVSYARSKAFRLEDDPDMANFWLGEWTRDLAELKSDLQRRSRRVRQVPSMWSDDVGSPRFVRP